MALSMSVSAGKHNARHNTDREYRAGLENVDPSLSENNVTLADEAIGDAYDRLFGEALERYNEKQRGKHPERVIDDYREKVESAWRADQKRVASGAKRRGNVPQPCYEYVIQIGNHDTWRSVPMETLTKVYTETFERLQAKTDGAIEWFQAAIHYDEPDGSGHMHVAGIPYGTGNKRGLETQVSMNQALRSLGLPRLPDLQNMMMRELEAVAHEHGIERDVMQCERKHQDVAAWKQTQRDTADMTARLEEKTAQVEEAQRRLESVRQREAAEAGDVAELDRAIEERRLEPAPETLAGSIRTLWTARGDGSREEVLAGEIDGLKSQIRELEGEIGELERGLGVLRARCERARERFEGARERVSELVGALREVPETLSALALSIAARLGVPVSRAVRTLDALEASTGYSLASERDDVRKASAKLDGGSRSHAPRRSNRDDR